MEEKKEKKMSLQEWSMHYRQIVILLVSRPERGERRERNEEYHEPANEPKDFSDELDKMDF